MAKDYDAIAAQFGGSVEPSGNLDALAAQYGGRTETAQERGAKLNPSLRSAMNIANAPTFGFADEIYGRLMPGDYQQNRDFYRGAVDSFKKEYPEAATIGTISGSMLSGSPIAGLVKKIPSWMAGATIGAGLGGVQGAGDSTADTGIGVAIDAGTAAAMGGVVGAGSQLGVNGITAGINNVAQRFGNQPSIRDLALNRVAESLNRDQRTGQQVSARLDKFGDQGVIADAAGTNTRQLLDTMAIQPGITGNRVENLIHARQAGRGDRLTNAAERGMQTNGQRMPDAIDQWVQQRAKDASPFYERLHQMEVPVNQELSKILGAAKELGAFGTAKKMATADRNPFTLTPDYQASSGGSVAMHDLDYVKRGLDNLIERETDAVTGKVSSLGRTYTGLKADLIKELDTLTTDPKTGVSLYKSARDAFSGPSQLIDAANRGKRSIFDDAVTIDKAVSGLSKSEQDAFRLGAYEALRNKLGTPSGQTEALNMWKNRSLREKLQSMFGDYSGFREFAKQAAVEARLKNLETTGRGSQTAGREARMDDFNGQVATDLAGAAVAAKSGNPATMLSAARNLWGRVSTPETVRNEIGRILLSPNSQDTKYLLQTINGYMDSNRRAAAKRGAYSGLVGQSGASGLLGD